MDISSEPPPYPEADDEALDAWTWRKTLASAWLAQFASIAAFSFVMPFLPFFLEDLGVTDLKSQSIWAGIVVAAPSWTMFIFGPVWGVVADKVGRKAMVMRAMFGGSVLLAVMGWSNSVAMLVVLRLMQGAVTGTVTASNALVSSVTPSKRASFSLGMMQTAVFAGSAVGPLIGGVCADRFGYRSTFLISGILMLCGGLLVAFFAEEGSAHPRQAARSSGAVEREGILSVLLRPGFIVIIAIVFAAQFSRMVLSPIFPLFVKSLVPDETSLKTITGSLFATTAAMAALTAVPVGRIADRIGPKPFLVWGSIASGLLCIPQAFVPELGYLYALRVGIGVSTGVIGPAMGGLVNRTVPRSSHGKAFGLIQSANSLGMSFAPLTGGFLGAAFGLTIPFIVTGAFQILVGFGALLALSVLRTDNAGANAHVTSDSNNL